MAPEKEGDMQEMVAYCGIVCTECPAYKATEADDNKARAKVAEEWSKEYQHPFKAEDINCYGCVAAGDVHVGYWSMCEIRKCGSDREVLNCAYCADYPCGQLSDFQARVPEARAKLESIRNKK
jgi:hypothetical protein